MASGNLLCRFGAAAAQAPAVNSATPDVRNILLVLDFDPAVVEYTTFVDVLPPAYGGGGLTVKARWMATTAVSGAVMWSVYIERHQRGVSDTDANTFGPGTTVITAAVAPSGTEMESVFVITPGTNMNNLAVGERFRLAVYRNADNAADTLVGDAELVQVDVYQT